MRELKFRVWGRALNGVGRQYYYSYDPTQWGQQYVNKAWESARMSNPIELCTGLKDKNGKEIYEGDIVRTKSPDRANFNAGAIEMVQQMYLIMNSAHYRDPEISHCEPLGYYCDTELEVIGNIHENPELLEREDAKG